jgi:hypothetical protein
MRKVIVLASIATVLATALVGVTPATAAPGKDRPKPIVVFIGFGTRDIIDIGDPGASHGDVTTGTGPVWRTLAGEVIGDYVYRAETIEGVGLESRLTTLWVNLPGGSLAATALIEVPQGAPPTENQLFVVLGGTGRYKGAQGTMTLKPGFEPRSSRLTFRLLR